MQFSKTTKQPSLLEFIRQLPRKQQLNQVEQDERYQSAMHQKHGRGQFSYTSEITSKPL